MTKSTITRERLQEIAEDGFLKQGESKELARIALAAMDSEPDCKERKLFCSTDTARMRKAISVSAGTDVAQPYRHAQPALVIPDEMTAEQAYEIGYYYGDPVNVFARGANWMRQHIIDSTLAAAQHDTPALNSVQSVVTVPGKWIPVSERMPENDGAYLCWDNRYVTTYAFIFGAWQANQFIAKNITHWMPLPAGPQEVR
ncbi:TPA: DUF551 domain-containing protein [Klebsiella pneumoniae]|nr:DUF551 domain-containing protein [Klebsiella pneumoniae]